MFSKEALSKRFGGKWSVESVGVLNSARNEAEDLKHRSINTGDILLGLTVEPSLSKMGLDHDSVRQTVLQINGVGNGLSPDIWSFTPRAAEVIERTIEEARRQDHKLIINPHLILSLIREGEGTSSEVMRILKVDVNKLRKIILEDINQRISANDENLTPNIQSGRSVYLNYLETIRKFMKSPNQDPTLQNQIGFVLKGLAGLIEASNPSDISKK